MVIGCMYILMCFVKNKYIFIGGSWEFVFVVVNSNICLGNCKY